MFVIRVDIELTCFVSVATGLKLTIIIVNSVHGNVGVRLNQLAESRLGLRLLKPVLLNLYWHTTLIKDI